MTDLRLRDGQVIRLPIRRMGINGEGVGYYRKQVLFVDGGIPGEFLEVKVTRVEKRHARARILKRLKPSSNRVAPPCPVYDECGGCQTQHIDYSMQLRLKRELVEEAFARYTDIQSLPIEETRGMEHPWDYRNKAQLPVRKQDGRVLLGMYRSGSHRLVDMSGCLVQHPVINRTLEGIRSILEETKTPIYDERTHRGSIRHVMVRLAFATDEVQIALVSRTPTLPGEKGLVDRIRRLPKVAGIILNHNPRRTSLVMGEENRLLWGKEKIEERLGSRHFALSAPAFFQLNPVQTEKLYEEVRYFAGLTGSETVVDAYCGTGTIGLWLADGAARVVGMDTVPEAVADARYNARLNGVKHAEYHVGKAETLLPRWASEGFRPDVVVTDPPRTGLGEGLLRSLSQHPVPRLIYVSCNPSTLAKDCNRLIQAGYRVKRMVPFDMFPQTAHVETCTLLVHESHP
ncbi:23S rRNA (uracil(1939)-C(5))-methyltransferase RlmD [Desmospora profundinema]|uniref:23S rRNA (Uracil-5-)-methyltransferase RumA n=1 Tax=Desmospora profundinema TaxID=1571184 RepID=A0ABU1ISG4_9BACL|nr:23S rRNA (uracil(1939)-C(5))-methyltransferase RlmD [Desmospora profundinema]MDR6227388.1 23S rRNA (uracil-5-)-methyltransferase RumA [Desmospora profundinema]